MNPNIELSLLEAEEKQLLDYIWNLIPEQDRQGMSQTDVLLVLDLMDDYLMENGLLEESAEEVTYLEGEIDETQQLEYLLAKTKEQGVNLTNEQIQLIMELSMQRKSSPTQGYSQYPSFQTSHHFWSILHSCLNAVVERTGSPASGIRWLTTSSIPFSSQNFFFSGE